MNQINDSESLNLESLKYNPSDSNEVILLDEACDPDCNFYDANAQKLDTPYISSEEFLSLRITSWMTTPRFNQALYVADWVETETWKNPSECYKLFFKKFLYENFFPRKKIKLKVKDIQSPRITSGIKKSSKLKQCLHEKFLKTRSQKRELEYKNYKNLFKTEKR